LNGPASFASAEAPADEIANARTSGNLINPRDDNDMLRDHAPERDNKVPHRSGSR
jgi:hypothetical protein